MDQRALDELRSQLTEATRRGFDLCRQQSAGQAIYAYALVMASVGGEALQPWCHTEESFARKKAKWGRDEKEVGFLRYNPDEWWATVPGPVPGGSGRDWWDDLRGAVHQVHAVYGEDQPDVTLDLLCDVLKALDAEGYFGTGAARAGVTLMVYVSDSGDQWWAESVRRLNPPAVVKRFREAVN